MEPRRPFNASMLSGMLASLAAGRKEIVGAGSHTVKKSTTIPLAGIALDRKSSAALLVIPDRDLVLVGGPGQYKTPLAFHNQICDMPIYMVKERGSQGKASKAKEIGLSASAHLFLKLFTISSSNSLSSRVGTCSASPRSMWGEYKPQIKRGLHHISDDVEVSSLSCNDFGQFGKELAAKLLKGFEHSCSLVTWKAARGDSLVL
nr:squalene monooxygenase-like [Ipomoea batatas]